MPEEGLYAVSSDTVVANISYLIVSSWYLPVRKG
jgi:hypothetical protein